MLDPWGDRGIVPACLETRRWDRGVLGKLGLGRFSFRVPVFLAAELISTKKCRLSAL